MKHRGTKACRQTISVDIKPMSILLNLQKIEILTLHV